MTCENTMVYLVGAGPGDAGLITVRGRELLERADIVVYDYLANAELLDAVPEGAERLYVGKKGFAPHAVQGDINTLLVDKARELQARGGGALVRLKGGDPFVFGRGGEEALALAQAGIPFQVVPGVTAGVAAPAYAGIPVTHRGISSSVTFITGHEDPAKNRTAVDWIALARLAGKGGTLCFYMGMRNLETICTRLMQEGTAGDTPVALVRWGSLPAQQALVSTLDAAPADAEAAGMGAPAIILVGQVAVLRAQLSWFERAPLIGRRIVVTRSRVQASTFSAALREQGADVWEFPTIEFEDPDSFEALDRALAHLGDYRWVVFTSVNGVERFFARLAHRVQAADDPSAPDTAVNPVARLPIDARALAHAKVAAIGPATARRLRDFGICADAVPATYRGEAVFEAIRQAAEDDGEQLAGVKVLIPRAQEARAALPSLLEQAGAQVDVVPVYKTVSPGGAAAFDLAQALRDGKVDALTFTSSSTARNLATLLGADAAELMAAAELFSIGPVTTETLKATGVSDVHEADSYTIAGLVSCLCDFYRNQTR